MLSTRDPSVRLVPFNVVLSQWSEELVVSLNITSSRLLFVIEEARPPILIYLTNLLLQISQNHLLFPYWAITAMENVTQGSGLYLLVVTCFCSNTVILSLKDPSHLVALRSVRFSFDTGANLLPCLTMRFILPRLWRL